MASSPRALDSSNVDLVYETASWRCAPCNGARCGASPTPLIVVVLIGLNYIPVVLYSLDLSVNVGTVIGVVIFHLLLGLMLLSWAYTCCTDPGTPPESWQRQMQALANRGESVQVCRRSGLYSA